MFVTAVIKQLKHRQASMKRVEQQVTGPQLVLQVWLANELGSGEDADEIDMSISMSNFVNDRFVLLIQMTQCLDFVIKFCCIDCNGRFFMIWMSCECNVNSR